MNEVRNCDRCSLSYLLSWGHLGRLAAPFPVTVTSWGTQAYGFRHHKSLPLAQDVMGHLVSFHAFAGGSWSHWKTSDSPVWSLVDKISNGCGFVQLLNSSFNPLVVLGLSIIPVLADTLLLYENTQEMLLHKRKRVIYVSWLVRAWWRATYVGSIHEIQWPHCQTRCQRAVER